MTNKAPESTEPEHTKANLTSIQPVIRILSYDEGVAYYVDWLGFKIDWEWREAPGKPVIIAISRDGVEIGLVEGEDHPPNSWIKIKLEDLPSLVEELNAKRPGSVQPEATFPYISQLSLDDPFGNHLVFEQPLSDAQREAKAERADTMRDYVRQRLADGYPCPTPEEVVEALFPPVQFAAVIQAVDVLMAFPEYREATAKE